jgi:starch synthase
MAERDLQLVLLGTGEEKYHKILRDIAKKHKDRFGIHIVFDGRMAKRIYAGCDLFLMPSFYEPCGLGQMIALRYGGVPLVRATGGLADTIQEFSVKTGKGTGFVFEEYTTEALLQTLTRALKVYQNQDSWQILVRNAMAADFSWTSSAKKYIEIYQGVSRGKLKGSEK